MVPASILSKAGLGRPVPASLSCHRLAARPHGFRPPSRKFASSKTSPPTVLNCWLRTAASGLFYPNYGCNHCPRAPLVASETYSWLRPVGLRMEPTLFTRMETQSRLQTEMVANRVNWRRLQVMWSRFDFHPMGGGSVSTSCIRKWIPARSGKWTRTERIFARCSRTGNGLRTSAAETGRRTASITISVQVAASIRRSG
jgi:hypothetical protein